MSQTRTRKSAKTSPRRAAAVKRQRPEASHKPVQMRLYVAGQNPKSVAALDNLRRICDEHLPGQYTITVIDLLEQPQMARTDQIVAIPTVVKNLPTPIRKLIGDMSDIQRVLVGLNLQPRTA